MNKAIYAIFLFFSLIPIVLAHGATSGSMELGADGTHHIEVIVTTLDGMAIPDMRVDVTIENQDTGVARVVRMHPMFSSVYHYGTNVNLPPGNYSLHWHLDPPTFMRGAQRENMWTEPIDFTHTFDSTKDVSNGVTLGKLTTTDMQLVFEAWPAKSMYITQGARDLGGEEPAEEDMHSEVMVAPRTKGFYWQTWAALIIGILGGATATLVWVRDKNEI